MVLHVDESFRLDSRSRMTATALLKLLKREESRLTFPDTLCAPEVDSAIPTRSNLSMTFPTTRNLIRTTVHVAECDISH